MKAARDLSYQQQYFERAAGGNVRLQPTTSPYALRHLERTLAHLQPEAGSTILEVGAGMGRFTSLLVERGLRVVASDLSDALLANLRARHAGLQTVACDVAAVADHLEQPFDRVVGFFMLHHLEDLDAVFAGLRRALRPGARVAFCEPNAYCPLYYVQIAVTPHMTWQGDGGVRHMRPSVVLGSLQRAGFVDTAVERYGFLPPFLYNRTLGARLDAALERVAPLAPVRAFQIFSARLP